MEIILILAHVHLTVWVALRWQFLQARLIYFENYVNLALGFFNFSIARLRTYPRFIKKLFLFDWFWVMILGLSG